MESSFDKALEHTVGLEGGYSNNPADRGGPTMWGISSNYAAENGYRGDIKNLTLEQAKAIYKSGYWDKLRLDDVSKLSEPIAIELFDTAVNMGTGTAGKFLQRALNCIMPPHYPDGSKLIVDGIIGNKTITALAAIQLTYLNSFNQVVDAIVKLLNCQQGMRYMEIVENDQSQAVFLKGWISNRVGL